MKKRISVKELAKWIEDSVNWLIKEDCGCCTLELDDAIAICVGWSDGYDENDSKLIHSPESPSYCITIGFKDHRSDSLRTDYDWLDYFEDENDIALEYDLSMRPMMTKNDYLKMSDYFKKSYDDLYSIIYGKDYVIYKVNANGTHTKQTVIRATSSKSAIKYFVDGFTHSAMWEFHKCGDGYEASSTTGEYYYCVKY